MVTFVEGDLKSPFSIATTLRCRGGHYSIPWIASLYPNLIMLNVKQDGIKYHFWVSDMTRPRIELRSRRLLVNTLATRLIMKILQFKSCANIRKVVVCRKKNKKQKQNQEDYFLKIYGVVKVFYLSSSSNNEHLDNM